MNTLVLVVALTLPEAIDNLADAIHVPQYVVNSEALAICQQARQVQNRAVATIAQAMRESGRWTKFDQQQLMQTARDSIVDYGMSSPSNYCGDLNL